MANNLPELNTITITCIDCGEEFTMSPAEQKFYLEKGYTLPKRCKSCRDNKASVNTYICKDCNKEFTLNLNEESYFKRMGLSVPKRCPECRKIKKLRAQQLKDND